MAVTLTDKQVNERADKNRARRMAWWHEARFGMFVHWGLYAQLGRHEWVMNRERIPVKEYEKLAATWKPKKGAMRSCARLAVDAGMKYMILTTKHHEGFCLWDTKQTDYNAVKCGPGRDLVREYVDECRAAGLKVGIYYSLMDWHHPDGARCAKDENARKRFIAFTHGCVRELMENYGKIDVLWYDIAWPLATPELWESEKMNAMVRRLQPGIIINERSLLPEDYETPEQQIDFKIPAGRAWEVDETFNESWGYFPATPASDWKTTHDILWLLGMATAFGGNLLWNIGLAPDGSIPALASKRLREVGRWLERYGEAVYGKVDKTSDRLAMWMNHGNWTLKGKTAYYVSSRWVGPTIVIGGLKTKVKSVTLLSPKRRVAFEQANNRLILKGLPATNPDDIAGVAVVKIDFEKRPRQVLGVGCV